MRWLHSHKQDKPWVLIVEDNQRQADLYSAILDETGLYNVVRAANGEEALSELEKHERGFDFLSNGISCILLDWQMPRMHGQEFLRVLRQKELKSPFKRHIPVVIITAFGDNDLRKVAEDSTYGLASAYLLKPFEESELLQTVKRIVLDKEAEVMRELLVEQRSRWVQELERNRQHK
jgi:CheY-like chemotaxis protein